MINLDLKKDLKHLYTASDKHVREVTVPPLHYIMIDGSGNPNTSTEYMEAITNLYPFAYGIRAESKAAGQPFTVMPLEGQWWWDDLPEDVPELTEADKDRFHWRLMILQPSCVTETMVETARETVACKKPNLTALDRIYFKELDEGETVQIMHVGPYSTEQPTVQKLHDYIKEKGYSMGGLHHEIYLNNPERVSLEKLKTIIRQPFYRQ